MDESGMSVAAQDIVAQAQRLLGEVRALAEQGELAKALEQLTQAHELDVESAGVTAELARLDRQLKLLEHLNRSAVVGRTKRASNSPAEALDAFREVLQAAQNADSGLTDAMRAQLAALLPLETRLHQEDIWARADGLVAALLIGASGRAGTENRILKNYVLPSAQAWFDLATSHARVRNGFGMLKLGDYVSAYSIAKVMIRSDPSDQMGMRLAVEARIELQATVLKSAQEILDRASALKNRGELDSALSLLLNWEVPLLHQILLEHPEVLKNYDSFDTLIQRKRHLRLEILAELAPRLCSLLEKVAVADDAASGSLLDACVDDAKLIMEHLLDLRHSRDALR